MREVSGPCAPTVTFFPCPVYLKILQQILSPSPINWHRKILQYCCQSFLLISYVYPHSFLQPLSFALPPPLPVPSVVSVSNQTGKIIFHTVALWIWAAQYTPSMTRTLEGMYFHAKFTVISKLAGPTNGQLASVLWITIFGVQDTPHAPIMVSWKNSILFSLCYLDLC